MLAVYLAETGVSRHSRPFLILTDEFNPSLQPHRGRERSEREREQRRGKQMDVGNRNRRERKMHVEVEKDKKTDRTGRGLEENRESA